MDNTLNNINNKNSFSFGFILIFCFFYNTFLFLSACLSYCSITIKFVIRVMHLGKNSLFVRIPERSNLLYKFHMFGQLKYTTSLDWVYIYVSPIA